MDEYGQSERATPRSTTALALWLQQLMAPPGSEVISPTASEANSDLMALLRSDGDHLRFYQQLPDLAQTILTAERQIPGRYASLLYHLLSCELCHSAYVEIYQSLRFATQGDAERLDSGPTARPLASVPPRILVHLCQSLIGQAELIVRQPAPGSAELLTARTLLRQAITVSAHLTQMRRRALQDLVRVAVLFEALEESTPTSSPQPQEPAFYAYSLQMTGSGARHGRRVRRAETHAREADAIPTFIALQASGLEGRISQQGELLELHLHDLAPALRGQYLSISLPLGSLLEPVRWAGGNPRAIRSIQPVDAQGNLTMPLGQTSLSLLLPEERNLLEVIFMLLEVRPGA